MAWIVTFKTVCKGGWKESETFGRYYKWGWETTEEEKMTEEEFFEWTKDYFPKAIEALGATDKSWNYDIAEEIERLYEKKYNGYLLEEDGDVTYYAECFEPNDYDGS